MFCRVEQPTGVSIFLSNYEVVMNAMNGINAAKATLKNIKAHGNILVTGVTGSGKSELLCNISLPDSKYYDFCALCKSSIYPNLHELCEENADIYLDDLLNSQESILLLDSVAFPKSFDNSKVVNFIKAAKENGKHLVIVAWPSQVERIQWLFGAVITLTKEVGHRYECNVEIL